MKAAKDSVVTFHYEMSAVGGDFSESSEGSDPVACLIGHGNVLPAIDNALLDREAGEELALMLEPADAYGERRENAVQRVPIKHLMTRGKLRPGMVVKVNTANGPRDATVIKVGKFNVDLDTNHPLAGKQVNFHLRIEQVREATAEEIAHGHAHGAGGHHH